MTALHCAAAAGQLEAAKLLSKSGADPAIADLQGRYAEAFIHMSAAHPSLVLKRCGGRQVSRSCCRRMQTVCLAILDT